MSKRNSLSQSNPPDLTNGTQNNVQFANPPTSRSTDRYVFGNLHENLTNQAKERKKKSKSSRPKTKHPNQFIFHITGQMCLDYDPDSEDVPTFDYILGPSGVANLDKGCSSRDGVYSPESSSDEENRPRITSLQRTINENKASVTPAYQLEEERDEGKPPLDSSSMLLSSFMPNSKLLEKLTANSKTWVDTIKEAMASFSTITPKVNPKSPRSPLHSNHETCVDFMRAAWNKRGSIKDKLKVCDTLLNNCWYQNCKIKILWDESLSCSSCGLHYCRYHDRPQFHECTVDSCKFPPVTKPLVFTNQHRLPKQIPKSDQIDPYKYGSLSALRAEMDANGNGKRGLPKLRDIIRRHRQDSDGGGTDPDLEFMYDDADCHSNEIAELYSYTEQPELQLNVRAFEDQMEQYSLPPSWQRLTLSQRKSVVMKLLDQLEVLSKPVRMRAARCMLYIAQGCWAEMQSDAEQQEWTRTNVMLLYDLGVFSAFTDLLNIEIENSAAAHVAMRKLAVSLADSQDLRVILSVLYTITEVIRYEKSLESTDYRIQVDTFCAEITTPSGEELLLVKLLGMVTRFCSGVAPHFPMKKVLLLLWKLILVSLGGMNVLKTLKAEKRSKAGLPPQNEDTLDVAKTMRASSPPASASDLLEAQNQKRNSRPLRRSLMKQSSLDDHESLGMELDGGITGEGNYELGELGEYDERRPTEANENNQIYNNYQQHRPSTPQPNMLPIARGLPWKPKVRQKDIDVFLENARMKFVGYNLQGDRESLAGLPQPIHEGVKTLKEHMYISLAELQIQTEEAIARNPLSNKEDEIELTPMEILYQAMLPNLPQYMIALLKILLAAAPTSKAKTDSINIMADVLPEEMPMTVLQSMKLGIDVNRHKEIIVKAVSAILLLLLKHFKLNHVYQFEFMSQHLVFANCIPLVLKFFNQNIMAYVAAKNMIPILDFPSCVIGDQPELTTESLEIGDAAPYSWRNIFSCINLLRILNKLTKWKHSRIMMLVVFKSAPILKRTLKVRHAMTQLYVLKLLKMQTKYLGRQWRKSNMKTISAIYSKVRHRLNDDWAFGNDLDARPWDFQAEECALRASVDRFNNRRYTLNQADADYEPVDNCLTSVLGAGHDLSESFKTHYGLWLEQEVFNVSVEWEKLLDD